MHQIQALVDAGLAAAQLGIESFSTPILKRMRKGVTAAQNLQTLKWFTEMGIAVKWNLLYGVPGEPPSEYAKMASLMGSLTHLVPPPAVGRIRVDRFSPYFEDPKAFGISALQPDAVYRYVYPLSAERIRNLAYYFHDTEVDPSRVPDYIRPVREAAERWRQAFFGATLGWHEQGDDTLVLLDTRPAGTRFQRRLRGARRAIYLFCDEARRLDGILAFVSRTNHAPDMDVNTVRQLLEGWVEQRIMAKVDGTYLNLALRTLDDS